MNGKVWTVKTLAEAWECSERHIYDLISEGALKAFSVSAHDGSSERKRRSGLRITNEEKVRWESRSVQNTSGEKSPSDGVEPNLSQSIAILAASAAVGG